MINTIHYMYNHTTKSLITNTRLVGCFSTNSTQIESLKNAICILQRFLDMSFNQNFIFYFNLCLKLSTSVF